METYNSLAPDERGAIEHALDELARALDVKLPNDDRAARAAEALSVYVIASCAP